MAKFFFIKSNVADLILVGSQKFNFKILLSVFSRFTRIFSSLAHYFYKYIYAPQANIIFLLVFPLLEKATISQQHEGNENSVQKTQKIYLS